MRPLVRAVVMLAAVPALAAAQLPTDLQAGTRVRVWLPEAYRQMDAPLHRQLLRGAVESVAPDTLRLRVPGAIGVLAIPRGQIRKLEVSRGRPSRVASAVERAVGGAIGGALTFALLNDPRRSGGPAYRTDWRAAGVGAAWGAGAGALLGLLFPHEQWRRVRLGH